MKKALVKGSVLAMALFFSMLISACNGEQNEPKQNPNQGNTQQEGTLSVDPMQMTLEEGQTAQIKCTVKPEDLAAKITFESKDVKVATVDAKGLVTAVAEGSTTINVHLEKQTKSVAVTVTKKQIKGKILLLTGYDNTTGTITTALVDDQYSLPILTTESFVFVLDSDEEDQQDIEGDKIVWSSPQESSQQIAILPTPFVHGCNIVVGKPGTITLKAEYNGTVAECTFKVTDRNDVMKELKKPFIKWDATYQEVEKWEADHNGTFLKKVDGELPDETAYTVYTFEVNDPADASVGQRAYFMQDNKLKRAYILIKPVDLVYDAEKDGDQWAYYMKSDFLSLLQVNGSRSIQLNREGTGEARTLLGDPKGSEFLGLFIYPDTSNPDASGKCIYSAMEYTHVVTNKPSSAEMKSIPLK